MNANFAWTYMISILCPIDTRGPEFEAARAAETALYLAQDAGLVSDTPRIHLASKAK